VDRGWTRGAYRRTVAGVGTLGDAVARNLAAREARGMPATVTDPAVWRIVANVLAQHAAEREKAPVVETNGRPVRGLASTKSLRGRSRSNHDGTEVA